MLAKRRHMLPAATWLPGPMQFALKDIPALSRIRAFVFKAKLDFLTGAAQAAIVSTQIHRLISNINIGGQQLGSGVFWHLLQWHMRGHEVDLQAGIPATNATHFLRQPQWRIPFHDPRFRAPGDDEYVANHFNNQTINVLGVPFASLDSGSHDWDTLASVSGLLKCWAELDDPNDAPGAAVEFGFNDLTGQSPNLDPGLYVDLFAYRESLATIDSTQVATIGLQADGQQVIDTSFELSDYLSEYNDAHSTGGDLEASSATAPVPGEALPAEPAATGGAAATVTAPWVPILWPGSKSGAKKIGGLLAERNLRIDYTGTDSTLHVGWRRIHGRTDAEMVNAFRELGRTDITSVDQIDAKTDSKRGLQGWKSGLKRYLPLRAKRSRAA